MESGILVSAQLSSLFPASQAASFFVHTSRQNAPLPQAPTETDFLTEHASFSSSLHSKITGTIILRVLHGGLVLELIFLTSELSPIRFVFPAVILPSPSIFLWGSHELHVLAVTDTGSLYRLVLPVGYGHQSWQDSIKGNWCREYIISSISSPVNGLVQVQGSHCVAIALPNGSLLRIENEPLNDDDNNGDWTESVFQHSSFLHSLTSFMYSPAVEGSEIVSMASHPWPTDVGHIWTLSRDRVLRLWKAKVGCVSTRTLSTTIAGRVTTPSPGSPGHDVKPRTLLEPGRQTLLRVFATNSSDNRIFVLAFIPTPSIPTSGGIFHLFETVSDQLYELQKIECSKSSAHCNLQDFLVSEGRLYTLWERQGQSVVERTTLQLRQSPERGSSGAVWEISSHAHQSELTPAYLEELLVSSGSLADTFLEAIMRPGMFSTLTLRTAIDRYTDSCLSLPGPPPHQLTTVYSNLYENIAAVVGCTVNLMRDPQTGALQHSNYQNALKRDWEGFIARCREIEQNGRWPLALGTEGQDGSIIVIERERVGSLVRRDLALTIHHRLEISGPSDPQQSILELSWMLQAKLGPRLMLTMESNLVESLHTEVAVSFVDMLQDQARQSNFKDELDEGLEDWIFGRVQGIEDIDQAIRTALDVVGGFDMEIKREEDEVELLLPPSHSDWQRATTAAYTSTTVEARYELCLSVFALLFYLSDDLIWDQSLLAEVFAVFRGVALLRFVTRQTAREPSGAKNLGDSAAADDVVTRLRDMHVSRNRSHTAPAYSLVHRLLAQSGDTYELPGSAHRFLDATGLLQSTSPANATKFEVLFCDRLRLLGCHHASQEMLSWLPRTPGVTYVLGCLWLSMGRADDASSLFEKLAGSFGFGQAILPDDEEALSVVLPGGELFDTEFSYYLHASSLFKSAGQVGHEVLFSQLALSVVPENLDSSDIWYSVIRGNTDLSLYDEAYASLMVTPYDKLRRECVGPLVYRMCEDNAIEKLMTYRFIGISEEVESALSFKARNVDPRIRPYYAIILHSWYVSRGDYRNAALTMYQRARKLHDLTSDPSLLVSLVDEQLEAYLLAINCLSLLDTKSAWIVLPVFSDNGREVRKRRRLTKHIPDSKYADGKHDAEIVYLADMQYDYALLSAQLELLHNDSTMTISSVMTLPPPLLVLKLAQSNHFDMALATARSLNVDMTELFSHLTSQCLRLSRKPNTVLQEDSSDWLLTDKVSSWPGTSADRGWRYLRQALERHDNAETDYKYTKVTFDMIVAVDGPTVPPLWLVHSLEAHDPEYLIRTYLRYEALPTALEHTLSLIRKTGAQISREPPKNAFSTWLPYTLIDEVLMAAASQDSSSPQVQELRQELNTEVANRVKRMQKLSQFSR